MNELTGLAATSLVFVFGTLKKGYHNHRRFLSAAELLGEAVSTENNYVMQDVGFPTLWQNGKLSKKTGYVAGEIYRVSPELLKACDRLESNGRMYTREEREFRVGSETQTTTAWVYLWMLERNNTPIKPVDGVLVWDREGQRKIKVEEGED
jgi:gamma-glutamylcyclotransferase (GGCT)/AIG2-like uncharacterized protein YtfP